MDEKYLRMIRRMPAEGPREWSVYMLRCEDGSLYTGIAKDVDARFSLHRSGRGASYTRTRRPVAIVFRESGFSRSEALVREAGIKRLSKERKERLLVPPAPPDRP